MFHCKIEPERTCSEDAECECLRDDDLRKTCEDKDLAYCEPEQCNEEDNEDPYLLDYCCPRDRCCCCDISKFLKTLKSMLSLAKHNLTQFNTFFPESTCPMAISKFSFSNLLKCQIVHTIQMLMLC